MSQCLESGDLYLTIIRQMAAECEAGMAQFSRGQRGHWAGSGADSGAPVLISPCLLLHISPSGAGAEEPHDHGRQNNDNGQQA